MANDYPIVYFYCPETRGHTLEEIDLIFMKDTLKDTRAAKVLQHEGSEGSDSDIANVSEHSSSIEEKGKA